MITQWLFYILSVMIYKWLEPQMGKWTFLIFVLPTGLVSVYFHRNFPETAGKSSLEIIAALGFIENKL